MVHNQQSIHVFEPTFVCVRSAKSDSSTVYSHAYDMKKLLKKKTIKAKPILLISTDGAQD